MVAKAVDKKKSLPKISVITVCLNAAKTISKTVESVLEQSYSHIEYIIVDGASTDNTKEIVAGFGSRINVFISQADKGLYDAMNKGVLNATGELVIFLNAGDYFVTKDALKFYISKMKLEEADLFFGRIVWNNPQFNTISLSDHHGSVYTWDLKKSNFPHPATVYKKKLFQTIGLFDLNYRIAADYEWNVRALVSNKVKFQYIDIIVTVFFADGISNNQSLRLKHSTEIDVINKKYYRLWKLYEEFKDSRKSWFWKMIQKITSKYFKCRLSRVY